MKIQIPYRCHNVYGCIEDSGEIAPKQETFPTEMYSTQGNSQKMLSFTTDPRDLTSRIVMIPSTDTGLGIINTEVFIYTLCGVSIFLILSFSFVCFCVHIKSKKTKLNVNRNIDINQHINGNEDGNNDDDDNEISQSSSTERETGHDYDEIDERNMSDFFRISSSDQGHLDNDNSSESSDGIRLPSDGYLNPYNPLQFMLQQSENKQEHSDENNHPSNKNVVYTNLYQSLKSKREDELRLYARCHSVEYLELVDEPLKNNNDQSIKEYSQRFVKTL
ncbi:unnamed protein product [Mytilus coruscus]|uniref:Uncharacterized protein n=1 Tax=Mytilus coruscus TaxID=42192 RepID=A0A6J8EJZ4_MYTCO|nr:unnamed protein product [Mytilus coruscus]